MSKIYKFSDSEPIKPSILLLFSVYIFSLNYVILTPEFWFVTFFKRVNSDVFKDAKMVFF